MDHLPSHGTPFLTACTPAVLKTRAVCELLRVWRYLPDSGTQIRLTAEFDGFRFACEPSREAPRSPDGEPRIRALLQGLPKQLRRCRQGRLVVTFTDRSLAERHCAITLELHRRRLPVTRDHDRGQDRMTEMHAVAPDLLYSAADILRAIKDRRR